MQSNQGAVVQTLQSSNDNEKIEVIIESHGDAERVALRYSTWTEGIGWCGQKTIKLNGEHLDDLHRALTVARHRINRRRAEAGDYQATSQVIQLPTLA